MPPTRDDLDAAKKELRELRKARIAAADPTESKALGKELAQRSIEYQELSEEVKATEKAQKKAAKAGKGFTDVLKGIGLAAAAAIPATTAIANPAAFARFQLATRDLAGVIGQALAPVLERVTQAVRFFADLLAGADAESVRMAVTAVGLAAAFATVARVIPVLQALFIGLKAQVISLGAALGVSTGGLTIILGLLAGAFVAASRGGEQGSSIMGALRGVAERLAAVLAKVGEALAPLLDLLADVATIVIKALAPVLDLLVTTFGTIIGAVAELLGGLLRPLADFFATVLVPVIEKVVKVVEFIVNRLKELRDVALEVITLGFADTETFNPEEFRRELNLGRSEGAGGRTVSFAGAVQAQKAQIEAGVKVGLTSVDERQLQEQKKANEELRRIRENTTFTNDFAGGQGGFRLGSF